MSRYCNQIYYFGFLSLSHFTKATASAAVGTRREMPAIEHKLNVTEEEIPEHILRVAEAQGENPLTRKETIEQFRDYIAGGFRCTK